MTTTVPPTDSSRPSVSNNNSNEDFSNCLLSQYRLCISGLGLGTAYGLKYSKGKLPMVVGGVAGSLGDFLYGYYVACVQHSPQTNENQNQK
jgi:hypothetical protein